MNSDYPFQPKLLYSSVSYSVTIQAKLCLCIQASVTLEVQAMMTGLKYLTIFHLLHQEFVPTFL